MKGEQYMTLTRFQPESQNHLGAILPGLSTIQREMNRFVDSVFNGGTSDDGSWGTFWSPAVDIAETEDRYIVQAELPGMTKEDVKISVVNNVLTIRGEKKLKGEKTGSFRTERRYGEFLRSFSLPSHIENEKIDARFENGLLTIAIPKVEEARPKMIEIKAK